MTITQAQLDEWKKAATEQDEGGCIEAVPALVAEVEKLRAALRKINARRYGDRYTVTPDAAWEAFRKANAELCAIYDEASAALPEEK